MSTPQGWYCESIKKDLFQRYWHSRRFNEVEKLIEPIKDKVLDIGCADGLFSQQILGKSKASGLIGIDVEKSSIDWANKHWKNSKMKFEVGDAHNLKFKAGTFDAVFALEMLEHVESPAKVLKEVKRVLKKDGYAIFLVPTDNLLFRVIWFLWLNFYPRGYVWRETHIQTYRNNYLPKICKAAGFIIEAKKNFNLGMLQAVKVKNE
jgi:2-polyprenyl-3-methyl-5-hydroxy-6-metoxy-1,4-benzoquinol methylase